MKKQITNRMIRTIISCAMLVAVLFTNVANASDTKSTKATPYELKYVGKLQEQPIFQLDINNPSKEDYYIRLEDEIGNVLYTDKFTDKNFSKKFQFDLSEGNGTKIKMTLISKTSRQTQIFSISNSEKVVENVVVTRVG